MAVIYDQFCSPKFLHFLKYTWYICGYDNQHPPLFDTPTEWCFNIDKMGAECQDINCDDDAFMLCAHCDITLCFNHSIIEPHLHC